ncbi:MAG: translocation and assembly module TamB [Sphingomonadales bacterium]|nr:translocation and assembly module TamB [Sphingomonadales bacterium]
MRGAVKKVTEAERDRGRKGWGIVDEAMEPEGRRRRGRWIALALAGLLVAAFLVLWLERKDVASGYIDRELARRGVRASYTVRHLGFGTQRLDNLVLGDPAHPDLTARWVEIRLSWGFRKPRVSLVTARGVRLYGRVVDGRLRFGELDKLLPKPSGAPFRLPDQNVDLADAAIRIDTPGGRIGAALEGKGNLASGFEGRVAVSAPRLRLGGCEMVRGAALWNVATETLQPSLAGPARAESLACGGNLVIRRAEARLGATLSASLTAWRGEARLAFAAARAGLHRIDTVDGNLSFAGGLRDTRGHADLAAAQVRTGGFAAGRTRLNGVYSLSLKSGRLVTAVTAHAAAVAAPSSLAAPILSALTSARGTPVEPVAEAWRRAVAGALRRFDAAADIRLAVEGGRGGIRFGRLDAVSASGARVSLTGASYTWPGGGLALDGNLATGGGDLPDARFALRQASPRAPLEGRGRIAPYAAGAARLALADIFFTAAAGATRIETVGTMDGPFSGGRVRGLVLPVSGRIGADGGFVFNARCTPASFRALETGTLRLGPARLPLCPIGPGLIWRRPGGRVAGGGSIPSPRFAGTLGRSPIGLAAERLQLGFAGPDFSATGLAVRLGPAQAASRLDIARLAGRFGHGVAGTYSGLSGKLAAVPLLISQGEGDWAYRDSRLALTGAMRVLDVQDPPRFNPLAAKDVRLTLADNRVAATGRLVDPDTGTFVGNVDLTHSLATGAGRAVVEVPGIRFDPAYQPEQLTRLTTGVVALVNGTVSGQGEIDWDSAGTSSTGTFTTKDTNLAASFGPVEKLTTTIHFTDLLGLVTAPGQLAEVGAVRTGIDVFDGRIRYQLLPGLKVRVEGGRWPFAGGELALEETVLDFSKPSPKNLTFRVTGMDAARFVQQMEFSNINATGTFDGVVPMIFDEKGGRILGGRLVARPEGGTLSYIGELTDKQLGAYGKLAFDALKSLRYDRLTVVLNGYLDGEFVAGIELNGIARDPSVAATPGGGIKGMVANRAMTQLAKIPFKFNITVRGPFRAVIGTARSLRDPTNLLQTVLPQMLRDKPTTTRTVQPQESETVR